MDANRTDGEDVPSSTARFLHALWLVIAFALGVAVVPLIPVENVGSALLSGLLVLGACIGIANAVLGYLTDYGAARLSQHRLFTVVWALAVLVLFLVAFFSIVV